MPETNQILAPPPPPRATGNAEADNKALLQWAYDFYQKGVAGGYFLSQANQFDPGTFDPSQLPDPASATVASAQNTANQAYARSSQALSRATQAGGVIGQVVISEAGTTAVVSFAQALANTGYIVTFSPVIAETGTPDPGAYQPLKLAKTTTGFTLTLTAAPGVGNSVTYQYRLQVPLS
jgi:hypothetical protein